MVQCVYAREVWHEGLQALNLPITRPTENDNLLDWWLVARKGSVKANKRAFDTFVIVVAWALWKQRNARVFNRRSQQRSPIELVDAILCELHDWIEAGVGGDRLSRFVRE